MEVVRTPTIGALLRPMDDKKKVSQIADNYMQFYDKKKHDSSLEKDRKENSKELVTAYYDVATDFFEYGWGESFHFTTLNKGEKRESATAKHEYRLALKLGLKAGETVLDMGCGVGGPARNIASFSDAKVIGLNINDYQLTRARQLSKKAGLDHLCSFQKGDFCNAPFKEATFSKIYAIEATCHAPDLAKVYGEAYRLLKPGGLFAFYEWIMTDKYDPENAYHNKIKRDILEGDGLPDLVTKERVHECLKQVGFEVQEARDLALDSPVPWQSTLMANWTLGDFKITPLGRWCTHAMLITLEKLRLAPQGSTRVHTMLCTGADGLVLGGKTGIFTPMYLVVARKPA